MQLYEQIDIIIDFSKDNPRLEWGFTKLRFRL